MCTFIVRDIIYISWFMKKTDGKVIIFYPSPAFGSKQCGCECYTRTKYPWGSKLPPKASSRCIRIRVHLPFLEYGQHSVETCQVLYLQTETIRREPTWGSLTTVSPSIVEWRASTWWDYTNCRMGSTRAIMVHLQSVHLNGHWCASELIFYP